jgi:hypothetical protein
VLNFDGDYDGALAENVRERVPWHHAEDYEHMLDGLCKAGWRE